MICVFTASEVPFFRVSIVLHKKTHVWTFHGGLKCSSWPLAHQNEAQKWHENMMDNQLRLTMVKLYFIVFWPMFNHEKTWKLSFLVQTCPNFSLLVAVLTAAAIAIWWRSCIRRRLAVALITWNGGSKPFVKQKRWRQSLRQTRETCYEQEKKQ